MNVDKTIQSAFAYHQAGNIQQAEHLCRKILKRQPKHFDTLHMLGFICHQRGNYDAAIKYITKALQINSNNADTYNNLGNALQSKGQLDEAITCYQKALQLNPNFADAYSNLGSAFLKKRQFDESITCYQKALQLNPTFVSAYSNLGEAFFEKEQLHEGIDACRKAIELNPGHVLAHFNLSIGLLLSGNFKEGWREYEWRWKLKDHVPRNFRQPLWNGLDIEGKTILLYAEQGLGDTIHFVRYVPLIAQRGAKVIVECKKGLTSLLKSVKGVHQVRAQGEQLPEFDIHCPLLSLPLIFNTALENIPANIPYITADNMLIQKWNDKLKSDRSRLKVGLVWAGGPKHEKDRYRSCSLDIFSMLAQLDDIAFYSLQKGQAAEQAKNPPKGIRFIDYTEEIHDFSDTAALIENLDLVISVDTAVAHLAGALGKPVWTLLHFAPDWRWLLNREDSPWYPTMRLFRQSSLGDWGSVIDNISKELKVFESREYINTRTCTIDSQEGELSGKEMLDIHNAISDNSQEGDFYEIHPDDMAIVLNCEGIGDCLFAIAVIKKIYLMVGLTSRFVIFTRQPDLFKKCPYVRKVYDIRNTSDLTKYKKRIRLFDASKLPHHLVDTFDFLSIPAGIGELSFREKQLEYFPVEEDHSEHFDVVINTSVTWPSRSWPIEKWQKVADFILSKSYSVAVVGKDVLSKADNLWKKSFGLKGCVDLTNKLSLDQTFYTIKNCDLFITCQNGLSVLSGATDTEIIVLDMSIEWSKRAIYRNEDPHYKVSYVKGDCEIYCCQSFECPVYGEFRCIPTVEHLLDIVSKKLPKRETNGH